MSLGPVMLGIAGKELTNIEREMLMHPLTGGVILFSRNYENPEQMALLVSEIHRLRDPQLLVAVDHEGGRVQRFKSGFTLLPAVHKLGSIYEKDSRQAKTLAELTGWLMAIELRSIGVDFSFAPVLDLDRGVSQVIGDRAFHASPDVVADLAHEYMRGMHRAGMAATGKHFPGHGGVIEDSHFDMAIDERRYEDLLVEDLVPFERMINYGLEAIMVAHVIYKNIDSNLAGFSSFWLQEILRNRLGFQGVIFSDDLEMEGAGVVENISDRALHAIDAGCDVVMVCQETEAMEQVLDGVKDWHNPVSSLRLARMHGHKPIDRHQLASDPAWKQAITLVEAYDEPHTLDLV